ncbi:MAG: YwjA [Candidatus Nomurabacteria bacterium GW2011_GWE1_32_28]|uniref:YwjA n=1 Tax=Candidatus Nomurabacteria bacterium GW2011_GWF1_31_48 TaxID=1618767 RepID=A0A0F9YFH6_9BACT|nr:MAG: YwjA [Candidatus Nomurabacteria bacterium GW2011_GWF2_30_133]KKP28513.1 MAG: YwjA [Candidatus Nomurabacteria bacterium GW2011_GWE2_31_40]KKP30108.1 MAG: YwjA [Candidatus Nomurabacteria bacterium GW2011_GWF1_31_48]KKP34653.1 MAG: YwjA [Candidatus Nomurabacteria bacterium GW2011_GWE1_32_28]HAS80886.1 ABC transporter ATP-binding protein [Candidatus Nomurabacteria bacterium]
MTINKEFSEIMNGFKRTFGLMERTEKNALVFASLLMLIIGVLTNLPAVILGRLVDKLVGTEHIGLSIATPFIILIIGIILVREALNVVRKYLVENVATQTDKKQTVNVIEHLLKTDIANINQQQIGSLHGRIFRSIQGMIKIIKLGFLDFFPAFFSALAAIAIALIQKPLLAGVMILVIPVGLFLIVWQVSSQKGIRVALLRGKEKIDGTVVEMLGGIETVRALNTENKEVEKVEEVAEGMRKKEIRHHIFMALFDSGKYLNEGFFYILVISLSIFLASQGIITKGDILVYSILFLSITGPLREIHRILDEAHESSIRVNDLYDLLNQPRDISFQANHGGKLIPNNTTAIEINNLSFKYKDSPVLQDISFTIKNGEKIGIAGASGCGKSTLIKILLRLVHGYSGKVEIFGKNLATINREEIADLIAYVPQKTHIFSGTIRDNIIYGCERENITEEEVIRASKLANLYEEIENSLGGLVGRVAENGNNLSGGQKQRLAIARLILKSPELLILDEATSALDNTNETKIQRNVEQLFKDKTTITIAHRLTTLKNTDRIFVFEYGRIVQEGTFDRLSNQEGLFQDFLKQKEPDILNIRENS